MMNAIVEDYICQVQEDGPCRSPATYVIREPYTPAATRILACGSHANDMEEFGYHIDYQETHSFRQTLIRQTPKEQRQ